MVKTTEAQLLKRIEEMDSNILKLREVIKEQKSELKSWKDKCLQLSDFIKKMEIPTLH